MERRKDAYAHPSGVLPAVKSVVMLGMNYLVRDEGQATTVARPSSQLSTHNSQLTPARVASYARGSVDYHDLIRERLKSLANFLHEHVPGCKTRGVVDTAPLLERDFARLAGLGWFGKNTLLINKRAGSFLFLAGLLTDVVLDIRRAARKAALRNLHAVPRRLSDRCLPGAWRARCDKVHLVSHYRAEGARFRNRCAPASATGSSAATFARTCAPGTARRRQALSPRSSR